MTKYRLREPDYIDLARDGWKKQPRDSRGRWTSTKVGAVASTVADVSESVARAMTTRELEQKSIHGTPAVKKIVRKELERRLLPAEPRWRDRDPDRDLLSTRGTDTSGLTRDLLGREPAPEAAKKGDLLSSKSEATWEVSQRDLLGDNPLRGVGGQGWADAHKATLDFIEKRKRKGDTWGVAHPDTQRKFLQATDAERAELRKVNNLASEFPGESDESLIERYKRTPDGPEKRQIAADLKKRAQVLQLANDAIERDIKDAKRAEKKDFFARLDANLGKHAAGRAVLRLRDKILADKTLDKAERTWEFAKEHGFGYGTALATAGAMGLLLGPMGSVAGLGIHQTAATVLQSPPVSELLEIGTNYLGLTALRSYLKRKRAKSKIKSATKSGLSRPTAPLASMRRQ